MFSELTNFKYKRSVKQAFGFYLAYFLLAVLVAALLGGMFATDFQSGLRMGGIVAAVASTILSFVILHNKKLLDNFGYVLLAIISGLLGLFGGGILGFLIPAYLTTK